MIEIAFFIWLFVFLILFIANLYLDNPIFGAIAGFWILILGLAVIITGIQIQSGMTLNDSGATTTVTYQYTDLTLPFSTYSFIFGFFLIGLSIYIIYKNAEDIV
jgi:hypothetical protein